MNATMIITGLLTLFSTTVMSYIAMATPIGPWIAPTVVLCALLIYVTIYNGKQLDEALIFTTIGASIGGIVATAFGFTFPTLYFLDSTLFNDLLAQPIRFMLICSSIALAAGWYGFWIADITEQTFIIEKDLPFPIGQMIYKMITAQKQLAKAVELAVGFFGTFIFCILQDGLYMIGAIIPKTVMVCSSFSYYCLTVPVFQFELWPMLWAIGFVTGQMIVIPLLAGSLSKIVIAQPIQTLFFPSMDSMDFVLAFCSGMVVSGVLHSFLPKNIKHLFNKRADRALDLQSWRAFARAIDRSLWVEGLALVIFLSLFFSYFGFTFATQWYLILCTFICAYQIIMIAGKIGLAQLGRFATFVLVPLLFLTNLDVVQITIISMFVEISTGVAVDVLFGRKVVALSGVDRRTARRYQRMGLIMSCAVIGLIFWLLTSHFQLGSPELFAQRGQARALLVYAKEFDYWVLLIGMLYGLVLKVVKLNPMLVLGGILMPLNISIGLVIGGLLTLLIKDTQEWFPFWSGVFAANSIWMLIQTLLC
jgi:hypothetical protein